MFDGIILDGLRHSEGVIINSVTFTGRPSIGYLEACVCVGWLRSEQVSTGKLRRMGGRVFILLLVPPERRSYTYDRRGLPSAINDM